LVNTINKPLKVLLIGVGRFGKNYLRILKDLEEKKILKLVGLVVKTRESTRRLRREGNHLVEDQLPLSMLKKTDAVFIVTPSDSHHKYIKKCLPFCHVFVEKPIGVNSQELKKIQKEYKNQKNKLMVGHIFRWHPVIKFIKAFLQKNPVHVKSIGGEFISPANTDQGQDPVLEHLHLFDIMDELFDFKDYKIWASEKKRIRDVHWKEAGGIEGKFSFGWKKNTKKRNLKLVGHRRGQEITLEADLLQQKVVIHTKRNNRSKTVHFSRKEELLKTEIRCFLALCRGENPRYPNCSVGLKITELAIRTKFAAAKLPNVGIIGGGVFGTTCALSLPSDIRITLFDENREILMGASFANQYRHHAGFHYPRSVATIREILESEQEFKKVYGDLIVSDFPSYYAIAKEGSKVSADAFLEVCDKYGIWYQEAKCPEEFLNAGLVSLTVKTKEAVYDYIKMQKIIKERLSQKKNIQPALSSRVTNIRLLDNGGKLVTYVQNGRQKTQLFDYLINATYSKTNQWCKWLDFHKRDLFYHVKELVVLNISPNPQRCAVTIMDGDYATLVPQGSSKTRYTFGDVPLSIHEKVSSQRYEAHFRDWTKGRGTRWAEMQRRCLPWFPILRRASYVSSMFVTLPVERGQMNTDGRPTLVTDHGYGCWSVLSGKIMTSVKAARQICEGILQVHRN